MRTECSKSCTSSGASQDNYVGNIYKGRIVNLEPSIQAAFVDFGVGRNGFLHISDVEPQYFRQGGFDPDEPIDADGRDGRRRDDERRRADGDDDDDDGDDEGDDGRAARPRRRRATPAAPGARPRIKPPIQDIFRRGDEVLVQVIKEGIGTKGPTLSTYISIPGRYLVLMPALGRVGVSRKIEDDDVRRRLRDIMLELNPPKGLGFIVRTAGIDRTKKELSRDLAYLLRLWKVIVRRIKKHAGAGRHLRRKRHDHPHDPRHLHRRHRRDLHRRAGGLRAGQGVSAARHAAVRQPAAAVRRQGAAVPQVQARRRDRPDPPAQGAAARRAARSSSIRPRPWWRSTSTAATSAPTTTAEETAYQLNLLAATEIARQLRLRDLGGVIVNDFIDMRKEQHRRGVERALRDAMKRDRARTKILRTSPFGLIEMTRQRIRPSLKRSVYSDCPCCTGRGVVKTRREHGDRGDPHADHVRPTGERDRADHRDRRGRGGQRTSTTRSGATCSRWKTSTTCRCTL